MPKGRGGQPFEARVQQKEKSKLAGAAPPEVTSAEQLKQVTGRC